MEHRRDVALLEHRLSRFDQVSPELAVLLRHNIGLLRTMIHVLICFILIFVTLTWHRIGRLVPQMTRELRWDLRFEVEHLIEVLTGAYRPPD